MTALLLPQQPLTGHGPALCKGGGVSEGGVCEVQKVLQQQAVLNWHIQHQLSVHLQTQ